MTAKVKINATPVQASIFINGEDIADTVVGYTVRQHLGEGPPIFTVIHICFETEIEGEMEVIHQCGLAE